MSSIWLVIATFAAGMIIGMPIAFTLIGAAFIGLVGERGLTVAFNAMTNMPYAKLSEGALEIIPLFILMGFFASRAGVSERAYTMAYKLVGHLRGGLAIATVFACAAFAATSGSSIATSAAVGRIALSEMKRFRYHPAVSTGTIASAGLLGIMIPPSIMLVVYGIATETHIGMLLIAGILPGILTATVFCLGLYALAWIRPELMPTTPAALPLRERLTALKDGRHIVVLFLIIVGGIYSGLFTTTEAAAVGAFAALIMALMKRPSAADLFGDGLQTARISAMIFLVLIGAGLFSQYVAISGIATGVSRFVAAQDVSPYIILILILLMYIPLGMFLEPISMCLITLPIVFPAILGLGFDPIWFGVLIVKMSELANITPPLGLNVYVIRGLDRTVPLGTVFKGASLFVFLEMLILVILVSFPDISTALPRLMFAAP